MRTRDLLAAARREGREAGINAAGWIFDGHNTWTREGLERILQGLNDGDPKILDSIPWPNLSGEWADAPTPQTMVSECGLEDDDPRSDWLIDEMCSVWETAASDACEREIVRLCRFHLAD
jgi:hypothetical protein